MAERTGWRRVVKRVRVPLGFLTAGVFLWLARPGWGTLAGSLPLVAAGVWLRGYAAGYVRKNAELTTTGPYGFTRNPLYLGSMLILLGFCVAAGSWVLGVGLLALFLAVYLPTIRSEEIYLRAVFAGFEGYAAQVPRLLPRWTPARLGGERGAFSRKLYLHHREYNAAIGAGAIYLVLVLRILWMHRAR